MIFDRSDYDALYTLFDPEAKYAGYKPNVKERPDATETDNRKRYLHVALKYNPPEWALRLLARAHFAACRIAESSGIDPAWYPAVENGTLRVLEYFPDGGTAEHADFDLFTVNCWRDPVGALETHAGEWKPGAPKWHVGSLGEMAGMGNAHRHRVLGRPETQRALIYFASPAMNTPLAHPIVFPATAEYPMAVVRTTGEWQIERTKRSRVYG